MKKMLIVIILFVILVGGVKTENDFSLLDYFDGEYYAYSNAPVSENYINLGSCYMNFGTVEREKIIGESMLVYNLEVGAAIQSLDAHIIKSEYIETGATVIYGYSNKINTSLDVDGEEINIQIACYDDYCVIGWPLILGSF